MPTQELTIDTLGDLDAGAARIVIDNAIRAAIADLDDRAADDGKPRVVQIKLTLERVHEGELEAEIQAGWKVPPYRTGVTKAKLRHAGGGKLGAHFQPMIPDNAEQEPLFDPPEGKEK